MQIIVKVKGVRGKKIKRRYFPPLSRKLNPLAEKNCLTENALIHLRSVLWFRDQIRKIPKLFAGSGTGSGTRGYGSGTGLKGIVSLDWKGLQMVSLDRFEV
jgi:hypothetical protein